MRVGACVNRGLGMKIIEALLNILEPKKIEPRVQRSGLGGKECLYGNLLPKAILRPAGLRADTHGWDLVVAWLGATCSQANHLCSSLVLFTC